MSSDIVIKVENLCKQYKIYQEPRDRLKQFFAPRIQSLVGLKPKAYFRTFEAVKDVSFEVRKGETVGIIGRNGSGKSTLLQMICGTLAKTAGNINVNGRVAALLELGSGFNPDFTGVENVYLNATILGLSKDEIDDQFDKIASFADIGGFIDQPVKTYSSGMYARLTFAVAINVAPDILIVDEALAVGDEPFQRKCYSKIERIRDDGASILLVTHDAGTITQMCTRALLLDHGKRLFMGSPKLATDSYHRLVNAKKEHRKEIQKEICLDDQKLSIEDNTINQPTTKLSQIAETKKIVLNEAEVHDRPSSEIWDPNLKPLSTFEYVSNGARILNVRIENARGERVNVLTPNTVYWYCYDVNFQSAAQNVHFGMLIKTTAGNDLGAIGSHPFGQSISLVSAGNIFNVRFPFYNIFSPGTYFMNAGCSASVAGCDSFLHRIVDAVAFRVEHTAVTLRFAGSIQISASEPIFASTGDK